MLPRDPTEDALIRLQKWGEWNRGDDLLDYAKKNHLSNIGEGKSEQAAYLLSMPEDVEETEYALCKYFYLRPVYIQQIVQMAFIQDLSERYISRVYRSPQKETFSKDRVGRILQSTISWLAGYFERHE